jgi:hypothetical protein
MTVNYTTLLALGQPVTGTESGTWGDDVNNAITSYLDIAIAGTQTITTDGDVTLTLTQGTSSATNISSTSAQYMILNCTGARTASRNIGVPNSSKAYIVMNNTTGGYNITIRGSTGPTTGITVTPGKQTWVAWDTNLGDFREIASGDVDGPASSTDNAIARFDGTTGKVIQNSAATIADSTGDITAGKYNGLTVSTTTGTLTIANGKTATVNNTITLAGTDSTTMTFPSTNATVARTDAAQTFTGTQTFSSAPVVSTLTASKPVFSDGSGALTSTGTLATDQGGTGQTSYTAGDLLYYATGTAFTKLGIGSASTVLTSSGSAPQWTSLSGISVGTATNLAGGAAGSVPYQTASSTTSFLAIGTANQVLQVNSGATAPEWVSSSGTGNIVRVTSATLVTPTLGVASATSVNKVAITAPATGATLTLADGSTLATSGANSLTFTTTGATNLTLPTSGTVATTSNTVASISFGTTGFTPSTATSGAVTVAGTLSAANGGTGVANNAANTITFTGNYSLGLTLSGSTAVTLPTTGTLATLAGSETLTNKTINGSNNTISNISLTTAVTGTLPTGNGGTGNTATPTNGQLLIGNGSGFSLAGLTAGSNITITNSSGGITIASTGGGTPGGSNTQIQFNNSSSFGGSANFTWDGTNVQIGATGALRFADTDSSNYVAFKAAGTVASNVTWTLPSTDGSNGQALVTNGTGTLSWATPGGSPGGSTTQLQYNNAGSFAGATNLVTDGSNLTINAQGDLRFGDSDSSNWVAFQGPATIASNVTWTLPSTDGTSGQFLSTDGSGTLSWATGGGGGSGSYTTYTYTGNGSTTTYAATSGITVDSVLVMENGVVQVPTTDYTISGSNIVFTTAPASGVAIQIRVLGGGGSGGSSTGANIYLANTFGAF